jgi:hypothetical protein
LLLDDLPNFDLRHDAEECYDDDGGDLGSHVAVDGVSVRV